MTPPAGDVALGVDVGGTKLLGVALDAGGSVMVEERVPTPSGLAPRGARDVVAAITAVVEKLEARLGSIATAPERVPIGVGVPGMVDRSGVLRFAPNLAGAAGADFRRLLEAPLGRSAVVENDANLALLAELRIGAATHGGVVVMVTLGTGIGGAVAVGDQLLTGWSGFAAEVGHMVVDPAGPQCPCGRRGCWERFASGGGLGRLAREAALAGRLQGVLELAGGDPEDVRGEHVTSAALAADAEALAVMEQLGWWVALGLANLTAVVDPVRIVVGGGLAEAGEVLLDPTRRAFAALVEGGSARPTVEIVHAAFGVRAGAVGAALGG